MTLRRRRDSRQGILAYVLEAGDRDDVTARAGLPLVVETMRALGLDEVARERLAPPRRARGFGPEEKLESLVTLLAAGGDRVEDVRVLGEDKGLERLLEGPFPSPDALLDFLASFHDEDASKERPADKKAYVPPESPGLRALDEINHELILRGAERTTSEATIDHDGTIIESHKRGTMVAYEGTRGYQPLVAVWAEQEFIVADEFRDGNVAGGEDPLSSVKRAFAKLPAWVETRRFRADSAAYYAPLLKHLVAEGIGFAISADMSPQLRERCVSVEQWTGLDVREHDLVDCAEVEFTPDDWPKQADPLRYIALRFTPKQTELFEQRGARYHAVVSNRRDLDPVDIVRWHRGKAGTIEQVHRALKDELGAAVFPSARFGANAAWFRINALTFNVLSVLKRRALPARYREARPKRLRYEIFTLPGRLTVHQSRVRVHASMGDERARELVEARGRLLDLLDQRVSLH